MDVQPNMVSIIMPSYNSSKFIGQSIVSVLLQTHKNWELIIIDDSSNDNTVQIIEEYMSKDFRIKLIKLDKNIGSALARNNGIKMAKGQYIAFLDSDDIWLPNKLKDQIDFMKENNLALTYSSYNTINEVGKIVNTRIPKAKISFNDMLKSNHIGNLTGIYDSKRIGKFYMDDIGHEDYSLWLKIMKKIKYTKGMSIILAEYRILSNSVSANKLKALKWQWNIYRNVEKLNAFQSIYYFVFYVLYSIRKRV